MQRSEKMNTIRVNFRVICSKCRHRMELVMYNRQGYFDIFVFGCDECGNVVKIKIYNMNGKNKGNIRFGK